MDLFVIFLLSLAGIVGGAINALAGGATLITFPVMLAAGMPPVVANASNAVAIAPGHLIAVFADREKFPVVDWQIAESLIVCIAGGSVGALLLLALPDGHFVMPVPALIGFATALFAFAPHISAWSEKRRGSVVPSRRTEVMALAGAAVYGGFFGAGLGIILSAVLSMVEPSDVRKVKVLKNLLATAVSLAAMVIFISCGMVLWQQTLAMMLGAMLGGYAGGYLVRVLPADVVRWFVIVAGTILTIVYAHRYWF